MPYRYSNLKGVHNYLDKMFEKHSKQDWDSVVAICGGVGVGKSNLGLHMLEYWVKKLKGKVTEKDIKHMCMGTEDFLKDLSDCKAVEMTLYDEAGELSSRRAMSKLNNMIMVTYQIIRADNIFTVLILPDIWYIDSYFRNTRIKGLFYVHKRGKVSFWSSNKIKKIIGLNANRQIKNYFVVSPSFTDSYPKYKGILAEEYAKMKQKKTSEARKKILENIDNNGNELSIYKKEVAKRMMEKDLKQKDIGFFLNVHQTTVGKWF